jgi:hypothetical protein
MPNAITHIVTPPATTNHRKCAGSTSEPSYATHESTSEGWNFAAYSHSYTPGAHVVAAAAILGAGGRAGTGRACCLWRRLAIFLCYCAVFLGEMANEVGGGNHYCHSHCCLRVFHASMRHARGGMQPRDWSCLCTGTLCGTC